MRHLLTILLGGSDGDHDRTIEITRDDSEELVWGAYVAIREAGDLTWAQVDRQSTTTALSRSQLDTIDEFFPRS